MSNHNYTQYSNNKKTNIIEHAETAFLGQFCPVEDTVDVVTPAVDVVIAPVTVKGVVTNCSKLNVRVAPNINADIACVVDSNAELEIELSASTDDWFSVHTVSGIKGYCMKQYVNV